MHKNKYFGYCYVLSYADSSIYEIELDNRDEELSTGAILKRRGLNEDECAVMYNDLPTKLETINIIENEHISD